MRRLDNRRLQAGLVVVCFQVLAYLALAGDVAAEVSGSTKTDPEPTAIDFLRGKLSKSAIACDLEEYFWKKIQLRKQDPLMKLGFVLVKRRLPGSAKSLSVETISVLVRESQYENGVEKKPEVLLRVAAAPDSGWVSIEDDAIFDALKSPFRGCTAVIEDHHRDPCAGSENGKGQVFLRPTVDSKKTKVLLEPKCNEGLTEALGRQGVIRYLAELSWWPRAMDEAEVLEFRKRLPASSDQVRQHRVWSSSQPWPLEEFAFLPRRDIPDFRRVVGNLTESDSFRPSDRKEPKATDNCQRIVIPRPNLQTYGFGWDWEPLNGALVVELNQLTDKDGCVPYEENLGNFNIQLANEHLSVRSLSQPEPVGLVFSQEGPFVFVDKSRSFFETLVASNIFARANEGLDGFAGLYKWTKGLARDVKIHQRQQASAEHKCAAQRTDRELWLPIACPGQEGYSAKGLCGDVVLHELAHEMTGSLVGLANAGWNRWVDDGTLDEGLPDFFALTLRGNSTSRLLGKNCQNDRRLFSRCIGNMTAKSLATALRNLNNKEDADVPGADLPLPIIGRLAILALLHDSESPDGFLNEFLFFAEKTGLETTAICESLKGCTGYCHESCRRTGCAKILESRLVDETQLHILSQFIETGSCQDYEYELIFEELEGDVTSTFGTKEQPANQSDFLDVGGAQLPFKVVLNPCPGEPEGERIETSLADVLPVEALAIETFALESSPSWFGLLPSPRDGDGKRDRGDLWQAMVSERGELSAVSSKDRSEVRELLKKRLMQGFSMTSDSHFQGWTVGGNLISIQFDSDAPEDPWKVLADIDPGRDFARLLPAELERPLLLNAEGTSRLEVLAFDTHSLTLADWSKDEPAIHEVAWKRPIDPGSVRFGESPEVGTVILATGVLLGREMISVVRYHEEGLRLEQLDSAWSVFPNETPGVDVFQSRSGDKGEVEVEYVRSFSLSDSLCAAPPYLNALGGRFLVMACDTKTGLLDLDGEKPEWREIDLSMVRGSQTPSSGNAKDSEPAYFGLPVVAPIPGAEPIRTGNFIAGGEPEWLVGPFLTRDRLGRRTNRFYVLDRNGRELDLSSPMVALGSVISSPVIGDIAVSGGRGGLNDDLDEVLLLIDPVSFEGEADPASPYAEFLENNRIIEVWQPREASSIPSQ